MILSQTASTPQSLELFSGSGNISKQLSRAGFTPFTVDINPRFKPDLCTDVMQLHTNQLPRRVFFLWISLPCTTFSVNSIAYHWKTLEYAHRRYYYIPITEAAIRSQLLLKRTMHILSIIKPTFYCIENPRGALRHMPDMNIVPYRSTISYGDYGFDYYKPTDLFHNLTGLELLPLTTCIGKSFPSSVVSLKSNYERSLVPPLLVGSIIDYLNSHQSVATADDCKQLAFPGL